MSTPSAIDIRNLKFRYPNVATNVLDIPELSIKQGQSVFLAGPSGSGKTTLLGIITGILSNHEGSLEILGIKLSELSSSNRDRFRGAYLGYIFQMFNLIPYLSVSENISLPCYLNPERQARLKTSLNEQIQYLAKHLEISGLLDKPVLELSVGQQQRVAAARALVGQPPLVIADEPTSALDTDLRQKFIELLMSETKRNNQTLLFVSHDVSLKPMFEISLALPQINKANA